MVDPLSPDAPPQSDSLPLPEPNVGDGALGRPRAGRVFISLAVGLLGAGLAYLIHVPMPYLIGPISAVLVLNASTRLKAEIPEFLRDLALVVIGVAMATSLTPQALHAMALAPVGLSVALATTVLVWAVCMAVYRFGAGWDMASARLAAIPGALSTVVAVASTAQVDVNRVLIAQTTRVIGLAIAFPLVFHVGNISPSLGGPGIDNTPIAWMVLLGLAALAWMVRALFWRSPMALLLVPILVGAGVFGSGLVQAQLPAAFFALALGVLGASLATRMSDILAPQTRGIIGWSLLAALAAGLVAAGVALVAQGLLGGSKAAWILALAPGGLETMIAISLSLQASPGFVASLHFARFLGIMLVVPILPRSWFGGQARLV